MREIHFKYGHYSEKCLLLEILANMREIETEYSFQVQREILLVA